MTLTWNGDNVAKGLKAAVAIGSYLTAEEILAEGVKNCPKQTGTLSRSGTISINKDINAQEAFSQAKTGSVKSAKKSQINASVDKLYISFNTPYAHRQHEDLNMSHDGSGDYYTYGGKKEYVKEGSSKYLEKAWNSKIKNVTKNIKSEAKKAGIQ